MLKGLKLENFEAHKSTELQFDNGINLIFGPSEVGKSSIIRALNFVINNRPLGNNFINGKDTLCSVSLIQDNNIIIRKKNKDGSINTYCINTEVILEAFGTSVPDQVNDLLNFNDLNIQKQTDRPFLLDVSGGEVAKYMNKIINLELIDKYQANIENIKKHYLSNFEQAKKQKLELEGKINEFDWVQEYEDRLLDIKKSWEEIKKEKEKNNFIEKIINEVRNYNAFKKVYEYKLQYKSRVNLLINKIDEYKREKLESDRLEFLVNTINYDKQKLIELEKIKHKKDINKIDKLLKEINNIKIEKESIISLGVVVECINRYNRVLVRTNKEIETLKKEYNKLLQLDNICPICGNKVKEL